LILLDTQVLVWYAQADERLGKTARQTVLRATAVNEACVSPITFWEAAMLADKGRICLDIPVELWTREVLKSGQIGIAGISPEISAAAGCLSDGIRGDPADRIIVATARAYRCSVLTTDRKILAYAKAGHVEAIDARH
jgi:PIN domain nuclease of toxin-antitoxin system